MSVFWPFRRSAEKKDVKERQPSELRIATSGSFSIRATVEQLKVDGAGSYAQPGKVRAALFVPSTVTTVQFHGDGQKRPGANARSSCVHVVQMFSQAETANILADAMRIGGSIGWCAPPPCARLHRLMTPMDVRAFLVVCFPRLLPHAPQVSQPAAQPAARTLNARHAAHSRVLTRAPTCAYLLHSRRSDRGVSLPTQDVLVQNLSKESQDMVHRAIREQLLPFARRAYPHLNAAFDKQPYPRPGNLFIVRYSAASSRPGGRGLKMHKDETALTFNLCARTR